MNVWKRILTILVVTLSCVGCDQGTKVLASEYLPKGQMTSYLNDILRIGYTENIGAFLGLGNTLSDSARFWIFVVLVGAFLFGLLAYLIQNSKQNLSSLIALSLIFSGGLSNFYDRVVNNGAVVDFLNIGIGSLRTGIFNVADIAIMLGVFMLFFVSSEKSVTGS
ncbi:signal peptidase II [Colwellia sp. 4_MG-2023]|jgi:signal peptidase II|uniref:signal peptidase II n=1 Tax=unclassified Colwellia TaxID=196834 RepID=UPI0026E3D4CD|nr:MULTISPECIES: signal peptidase II [unclassified Colwellia]MDO6505357.1 signal peptidase II [Colwellia sp. 5_MG-2023]MDO6554347.1 signal peptidase II [Colwellia sp. 4_MG-2023]